MTILLINSVLLIFCSYLGQRLLKNHFSIRMYWVALVLKLSAGICLGLIFHYYYQTGDTIFFFESAVGAQSVDNQPRTQFFVSLLKPIAWWSGESYWITSLWMSLFCFLITWYGVSNVVSLYPSLKKNIAVCFLFVPTVVFWSSGILKDTVASAALVVLIAEILAYYHKHTIHWKSVLLTLLATFILWKIKHYLLIAAFLFAGVLLGLSLIRKLHGTWKFVFPMSILFLAFLATQNVHPYLNMSRLPLTLYENNQAILLQSDDDKKLDIIIDEPTWNSVLEEVPAALQTGLLRPSILDATPIWGYLHRIENLVLSILLVLSVILWIREKVKVDTLLLVSAASALLLLIIFLPLSTPNFGSLVRYKSAYMPYLFLLVSIIPFGHFFSKK